MQYQQNPNALFPPYLNKGSKGTAVLFLQRLLTSLQLDPSLHARFPNPGVHDEASAEVVKKLQANHLGRTGEGVDGHFGPNTRALFRRKFNIDINAIMAVPGEETEWVSPAGPQGVWPVQSTR